MFANIGNTFRFADVAKHSAEAEHERGIFIHTIHVAREDLQEAERLISTESVYNKLTATPQNLLWTQGTISNAKITVDEIGKWIERAGIGNEATGSHRFDTRIRRIFSDPEKLLHRKNDLLACHQQLSIVLGHLARLEDLPNADNVTHLDDLATNSGGPTTRILEPVSSCRGEDPRIPYQSYANHHAPTNTRDPEDRYCASLKTRTTPFFPSGPPPNYTSTASDSTKEDVERDSESEHQHTQQGEHILELPEDGIHFSGTNTNGPVNPFELTPQPPNPLRNVPPEQRHNKAETELPEHRAFIAELPGDNPGPPPGYPPKMQSRNTFHAGIREQENAARDAFQRRSMSDPVKMPWGRPPSMHARDIPAQRTHHEPPSSGFSPVSPSGLPAIVLFAPPSHPLSSLTESAPSPARLPPYTHRPATPFYSDRPLPPPLHTPAPAPPPLGQSSRSLDAAVYAADTTSSWGLGTQPTAHRPGEVVEPQASSRMHGQKMVMEMLWSIGT